MWDTFIVKRHFSQRKDKEIQFGWGEEKNVGVEKAMNEDKGQRKRALRVLSQE